MATIARGGHDKDNNWSRVRNSVTFRSAEAMAAAAAVADVVKKFTDVARKHGDPPPEARVEAIATDIAGAAHAGLDVSWEAIKKLASNTEEKRMVEELQGAAAAADQAQRLAREQLEHQAAKDAKVAKLEEQNLAAHRARLDEARKQAERQQVELERRKQEEAQRQAAAQHDAQLRAQMEATKEKEAEEEAAKVDAEEAKITQEMRELEGTLAERGNEATKLEADLKSAEISRRSEESNANQQNQIVQALMAAIAAILSQLAASSLHPALAAGLKAALDVAKSQQMQAKQRAGAHTANAQAQQSRAANLNQRLDRTRQAIDVLRELHKSLKGQREQLSERRAVLVQAKASARSTVPQRR